MQHPIAIYHLTRIPAMWAVIDCIGTAYDKVKSGAYQLWRALAQKGGCVSPPVHAWK